MEFLVCFTNAATPSFPLPPTPTGHGTDRSSPTLPRHSALTFEKIVGQVECRSRRVDPVGDYDRRSRQSDARVQLGNLRVVPLCHFAQEYLGEQAAGKPELAGFDSVQIENRNDATNGQGKLHKSKPLQLSRSQGSIRGSEINGSRPQ